MKIVVSTVSVLTACRARRSQALATGAMLIIITIVLVLVLMVNKWILTKKTATCLLFLYALYVGAAILFQCVPLTAPLPLLLSHTRHRASRVASRCDLNT